MKESKCYEHHRRMLDDGYKRCLTCNLDLTYLTHKWNPVTEPPDDDRLVLILIKGQQHLAYLDSIGNHGPRLWWLYTNIGLVDESRISGWRDQ